MYLERLYDRSTYDPEALATARAEVQRLTAALQVATMASEIESLAKQLQVAHGALAAVTPRVDGVRVINTGATARQNFSTDLVRRGTDQGWLERAKHPTHGDVFILHSQTEDILDPEQPQQRVRSKDRDLIYTIEREPGYYCCHCGEALSDDAGQRAEDGRTYGQHHVVQRHATAQAAAAASGTYPDPNNPAGYRRIAHYECVLVEG